MNYGDRLVKINGEESSETIKYMPSTTEILLEEMCESFGTKLLQGYIDPVNGTKLIRESIPVIVKHPNGKRRVLQFQSTRFSRLHSSRVIAIYNENRARHKGKRKISAQSAWEEISKEYEKDSFREITNQGYIQDLSIHRWEKELYFVVYDASKNIEKTLEPFLIHESNTEFNKELPIMHITFHIEPFFVIGGTCREPTNNIYDNINIFFPQIKKQHKDCIDSALSLHPLNKLNRDDKEIFKDIANSGSFNINYKVQSGVSRKLTMGLINAYLRKFCLDKEFY